MASNASSKKRLDYFNLLSKKLGKVDGHSAIYQLKRGLIFKHAYGNAADIGAGEGVYTEWLASVCRRVTAIDENSNMLEHLKERLADFKTVTVIPEDVLSASIKHNTLDTVLSYSTLYLIPKYYDVLYRAHSWMVEGGTFIFDVTNYLSLGAMYSIVRWPITQYSVPICDIKLFMDAIGFDIIEEHKTEAIPRVNLPFLKYILDTRIGDISLDELISSLPVVRNFAFRTTFVVQKRIGTL